MESSGGKQGDKAPDPKQTPGAPESGESATTEAKPTQGAKPKAPKPKPKGKGAKKAKAGANEPGLWFRFTTRVRAAGYWLREKLQAAGRALGVAGERLGDFWQKRSIGERIGIGAGAALVLLLLLVRVVPVPGIPCQVSVKECAPAQESFALVPADALLYAHLTIDEGSDQFERSTEAFEQLSDLRTVVTAELPGALPTPSGTPVDISQDVLPWAERDLALILLPGPGARSQQAFVAGVEDQAGAEAFLTKVAPDGELKTVEVGDDEMSVYAGGFAAALIQDSLVFGEEPAVRASINAASGNAPALEEDDAQISVREQLPEARFAEVFLSRSGVQRLLAGRAGAATQLETFVDYGASDGLAAAAVAKDEGIEIVLVSSLNPELLKKNPSFFSELPTFEPTLTSEAAPDSIAYAGVGEVGPTVTELLSAPAGAAAWLGR